MYRVTLIPGDGIGPEITKAATRVVERALKAVGTSIQWEIAKAGTETFEECGVPLPTKTLESIARNKVALKGPLATPNGRGFRSVNVALRQHFDLFVGLRPIKLLPGVKTRYFGEPIDMVIFRENTEGFYVGEERYVDAEHNIAEATGRITRQGSERIFRYAFNFAKTHGRRRLTIVHKANILQYTHGLFLEVGEQIAQEYPEIQCNNQIVDNMSMQLIMNPAQFDVIVTTNLLGDIVSDACAALIGGLGFAPSANIGREIAIFEAVHGTAPDIAGQNIANPCAIILSSAMMLEHLGEEGAALKVKSAVETILCGRKKVTKDISPRNYVGTNEMADAIIDEIEKKDRIPYL